MSTYRLVKCLLRFAVLLILARGVSIAHGDSNTPIGHKLTHSSSDGERYASSKDCQSCHESQFTSWQNSHHAKAMQTANSQTVLADFNQSRAEHFGQKALFFIEQDEYKATVSDEQGKRTYTVEYTFGVYPLQQYLVATNNGRYQVLPFAWDTRDASEGGQRWMHLYPNQAIAANDRLHWQQPLQNWNGMCADCHSDGLVRNYDDAKNTFATRYDEINVGCLACHDDKAKPHAALFAEQNAGPDAEPNAQSKAKIKSKHQQSGLSSNAAQLSLDEEGMWIRGPEQAVAEYVGKPRSNDYEQTCYACHSLRAPLTDGFDSMALYLDQFSPNFLNPPMYYADGQIREEVYVMGSFKQSKMAQKGVTCIDCHDPHSYTLKAKGNGTCLQCHSPQVFETPNHHGHALNMAGSQCVDCHMPKTTYMNVDARGDHSFKIPRPEFTISAGVPNACNQCHEDKSAQWALDNIEAWHPERKGPDITEQMFLNLFSGLNYDGILRLANNTQLPEIKRATAISALQYAAELKVNDIVAFFDAPEPLLRLASAQVAERLSPVQRQQYLWPLLSDELRAVRIAAAYSMLGAPVLPKWQTAFERAFIEMNESQAISAWRGEGRMQQAMSAQKTAQWKKAEQAYELSIYIDPYFAPAYINLTELYRQLGQMSKAVQVYEKGIKNVPQEPLLRYSYALHFIRTRQLDSALAQVNAALEIAPRNSQFAYLYYLILESAGKREQAINELRAKLTSYDNNQQLQALLNKWGG
ncbi:ammonia-forming cytochrome c nitrite reductase subunit c552 [Glaciecola siphonariae]|uniref:Ammonia-forming cytochrome c nitrite reductase subunit c552 n=1 Tax=Glaciecola siphonariae TaxID=521012 RepID=A0ABV9LZ34_9ALTE